MNIFFPKMFSTSSKTNSTNNSLPNDKILDMSKLKAFADDKINATQKFIFVLRRVENIVGKGENANFSFSLFFFLFLIYQLDL